MNKWDLDGKCATIADESRRQECDAEREQAIETARSELEDASVRAGARESAVIITFDEETGEVVVRTGDDAGKRTGDEVIFTDEDGNPIRARTSEDGRILDSNIIILATGHSHSRSRDRTVSGRAQDRANEDISGNENDTNLSRIAPAVIKTPSGEIKVFRDGEEI